MRLDAAGRMAFAMIAMVLLLLSIFSGALIAMVSKETSTEAVAVRELRDLSDAIEEARVDIENQAYDVAVARILAVVRGELDEGNLSTAFMGTIGDVLSRTFPRTYEDVEISIDAHNITIQPLIMSTRDIVPAPPSDSPENRWGVNTTGELNVTSRIPYYKVAGILNVTATDVTAPTWRLAKAITIDRDVAIPYPLLAAGAKQVYFESSGGKGELGRVIKYILTTVAQYRALAGYGTPGYLGVDGFPKLATDILVPKDVELAVNLAILLQQARLFRTVDNRSVGEFDARNNNLYDLERQNAWDLNWSRPPPVSRSLQRLFDAYVITGTIDPADLIALYIGLDGVPLDLERMVDLSAGDHLRDMFVLKHLRDYHALRQYDESTFGVFSEVFRRFFVASQKPDLFISLVPKSDSFLLPWSASAARWAAGLAGELSQEGTLDSRFSDGGHLRFLVEDDLSTYPVDATTTSRTRKVFSREGTCSGTPVYCDYYYRNNTYSINSPIGDYALRFDHQYVTTLFDAPIWKDFYDLPIDGVNWTTLGQGMITALYQLLTVVGQEIARQAGERVPEDLAINPKDFHSTLESVYDAVHTALRGTAEWFNGTAGRQWLRGLPDYQDVVAGTSRFVLHLQSLLNGPVNFPGSCTTAGYDCLVDKGTRIQEAIDDRASRIFDLTEGARGDWSVEPGPDYLGGNCPQVTYPQPSPCFDYWNQADAEIALRQPAQGMKTDIASQVVGSVGAAYDTLSAGELQSIGTASNAFAGSAATGERLERLVAGAGQSSFVDATVSYIERSVNLAPLHDFLSVKVLETAEFGRPFEFWLGNESDARERGRIRKESLVVRQSPPYLRIDPNNLTRGADEAHMLFDGEMPQNFTEGLGVYLDLVPEGRYNTEAERATSMPYQNRWNVSILGVYQLNVSSAQRFLPRFVAPYQIYYNITVPIDLCFTIDPITTWQLENVGYRNLYDYVKNLEPQNQQGALETIFGFLTSVFNPFPGLSELFQILQPFDVREPVQAIAKHQIAISRFMISQLASGYVDAAVTKTMETFSNRLTKDEILWAARISLSSGALLAWGENTTQPISLSFPGFEVLARPEKFGVNNVDDLPNGMAPWLGEVTRGLQEDGYNGPAQGALLRLDIIQGERTFCGAIENSHGFISTWLVKKHLELAWMTDSNLSGEFSLDEPIVTPLTYYAFNVRGAEVRFTSDPMRVQQYYSVAGQARWTDGGRAWGATVYLPETEFHITIGKEVGFDIPLPFGSSISISIGIWLNTFFEIIPTPGEAFINELGRSSSGASQWVEIWHPWVADSSGFLASDNWKLVAARKGTVENLTSSVCSPGNETGYTVCEWPNGFFSPGVAARSPINPLDSLMLLGNGLLGIGNRIVDYTPFDEECDPSKSFHRSIDGAPRWVCDVPSRGETNWDGDFSQALESLFGLVPGIPGLGPLGMTTALGALVQTYRALERTIGLIAAAIVDLEIWLAVELTLLFVFNFRVVFTLSIDGEAIEVVVRWLLSVYDAMFHAIISSSSNGVTAFPQDELLSGLWFSIEATAGIKFPEIPGADAEVVARLDCGYSWGWNIPWIMKLPRAAAQYWGSFCEGRLGGSVVPVLGQVPLLKVDYRGGPTLSIAYRIWSFRLDKFALD